jgi:hypothetical protein
LFDFDDEDPMAGNTKSDTMSDLETKKDYWTCGLMPFGFCDDRQLMGLFV